NVPVLLKLENGTNADFFHEVTLNTTVAGGWEELEFDFSDADLSDTYDKVVIFYNFGNSDRGTKYYFDDIELTDGSAAVELPLNFESPDIEFTFDGFGGASAEVVDNPDATGINASNRVGAFTKMINSETWGGVFIDAAAPIDFSGTQRIRLKIWSPVVGASILLKLESPSDGSAFLEVPVSTTVANAWEELEYDFSGIEAFSDIRRVVIFCDFGNSGTEQTYYFDDIELVP
ncbi:MAG: carbohydrate-binding protein, partial [Bacteroidota bacterium]